MSNTIDKFIKEYLEPAEIKSKIKYITLEDAADLLGFKTYACSKILELIKKGVVNHYRLPGSIGFGALRFAYNQISKYRELLAIKRSGSDKNLRKLKSSLLLQKTKRKEVYLTSYRVSVLLGISPNTVDDWINKEILKSPKDVGQNNSRLVPLDEYIRFRQEYLFTEEAAKFLDIHHQTLLRWVRYGRIKTQSGSMVDGHRRHLFCKSDLLPYTKENRMTINSAADYVGASRRQIESLIQNGMLNPISGPGIDQVKHFLVIKSDVDKAWEDRNSFITCPELEKLSGISDYQVKKMIDDGEIKPAAGPGIDDSKIYTFARQAVEAYTKLYRGPEAAKILGVKPETVRKWTYEGRTKAIKGPTIDESKYYYYRLIDINEAKKSVSSAKITLLEAANILGVSKQKAWTFIKDGSLKPCCRIGTNNCYYFQREEVERFKERSSQNVVSANEAAHMLGEDLSWFYKKWVHTGRLQTVDFKDQLGKHFFKKVDVEQVVKFKALTITGPELAKKLGVARTTVMKWTKSGKIKPVSGPGIDGFGCYLYLNCES